MEHSSTGDTFLGLDVNIESTHQQQHNKNNNQATKKRHRTPTTKTTKASANHPKHPRPKSHSPPHPPTQRPQRPPPTPDPPASLVALLRSDATVLRYFQSLQSNLDYDVDKWKCECERWKRIAMAREEEKGRGVAMAARGGRSKTDVGRTKKKVDGEEEEEDRDGMGGCKAPAQSSRGRKNDTSRVVEETRNIHRPIFDAGHELNDGSVIPITDEALFGGSDDDDDDSANDGDSIFISNGHDETMHFVDTADLPSQNCSNRATIVRDKLKCAKEYLDSLGVSLVEVQVRTIVQSSVDNSAGDATCSDRENMNNDTIDNAIMDNSQNPNHVAATITTIERILHRQSDEVVAADIMASLKTLIKASSVIAEYNPSGAQTIHSDEDNDDDDDASDNDQKEDHAMNPLENEEGSNRRVEKVFWSKMCRQYHPFCFGKLHVPTVYHSNGNLTQNAGNGSENENGMNDSRPLLPPHPAAVGLDRVINILLIMSIYCRDDLDDTQWDAMFDTADQESGPNEELLLLQVGMRNRCRVATRILSSLDAEITRIWALADRATLQAEPSVFFHVADVLDSDHEEQRARGNAGAYCPKIYNRLVNLEERIAHARMATVLHRRGDDWQKAAELVVGYIVSCAPSLGVEEYPKLPPVLSMCVLEALLSREGYCPLNIGGLVETKTEAEEGGGWFERYILFLQKSHQDREDCNSSAHAKRASLLLQALSYPIHVAALTWKERSFCTDDRIRDIALIEIAAYHRLRQSIDGMWLDEIEVDSLDCDAIIQKGSNILESAMLLYAGIKDDDTGTISMGLDCCVSGIICALSLVTMGDIDRLISLCDESILSLKQSQHEKQRLGCLSLLPLYCSIYVSLMCRKWDAIKLSSGTGRQTAAAFTIIDRFSSILEAAIQTVSSTDWRNIDSILQCCVLMGDGFRLLRVANSVLPNLIEATLAQKSDQSQESLYNRSLMSRTMTTFIDVGEIPTVRVINLKRRPDRLLDFMSCASKEQLVVIKGPISAKYKLEENEECTGDYAFDGKCSYNELKKLVSDRLHGALSDFVADKWRPGDLRAFDRDAPEDSELVQTSLTEKACALSHIASWVSVEKSLSESSINNAREGEAPWYQKKALRMLKISGFARGEALLVKNEGVDPSPCCVILEDDAVLCDRFAERLASLLEELPRDFHFCSIGYSRPQRAPIVEYSSQLGIPSCLWYLTGYVVSLEGVRHLLESLPVAGPVDSWIGMKMCHNWDNIFGQRIGVGKHTKTHSKPPSRKDLAQILRFRAFAALVPLCEQKNSNLSPSSDMSRGGWRNKDTDIAYSGYNK
eukprot:CCRYP_001299-RA/>CCRYP_001299-RA protein AED:0.01 eAED:0.01 QI:59/1/1/1/1/1/3/1403/1308